MNKKVSTIFAMAALAGGVFCGSAYAQDDYAALSGSLLDKYESGSVMLANKATTPVYLNYTADADGVLKVSGKTEGEDVLKKEILNNTWNVRVIAGDDTRNYPHYIFVNAVTGDTLSFKKDGTGALLIPNKKAKVWAADGAYTFTFEEAAYKGDAQKLVTVANVFDNDGDTKTLEEQGYVNITTTGATVVRSTAAQIVNLYKLATAGADVKELNALYNGKGFNLGVKKVIADADVQGNIFDDAEQSIWAFKLESDYKLPNNQASSANSLYVPAGVYLFTNPVFKNGKSAANYVDGADKPLTADDIDWLNSTLVALSPSETLEATDVARADGEGFKLITEKGTNFIFKSNTSEPQGNDLYISNACFEVTTNYTADYPYAIAVKDFYYHKSKTYKTTDKQSKESIYMTVSSYNNAEQALVTKKRTTSPEYIFTLKASSVVEGKSLLHTTKKAAIYTIKFIGGNDLNNKYLTVGADRGAFQWEAKGAAIAETSFPIFQFVITAVNDETNDVTFTNRETGEEFTTKLFKEDGANRYSLSTTELNKIVPFTVNTDNANTYEVEALDDVAYTSNVIVELQRLDNVDQYAGFLNIDNDAIRTLAFARDKNDTSNKFYAVVGNENNDGYLNLSYDAEYTQDDIFVDDITSAAQWQIVKGGPVSISRVYVYNNTETESIDDVPNGDKVSAYVYALRYVTDGTETDWFLSNDDASKPYDLLDIPAVEKFGDISKGEAKFIIKENVDGSVSLMKRTDAFKNGVVALANVSKAIDADVTMTPSYKRFYTFDENVYESASQATNVKTYLDAQPIEISWPAQEGHVTMMSELGNYITMNEDRDAIVVNENEADTYYLYVTDKDAIVPSFYITKGVGSADGERMFMFNPTDSVDYYVASGDYDKVYQWYPETTKVLFKAATINETRDTLAMDVKGETKYVAKEADDDNADIWGGINRFKWQIIEAADAEGYYYVRQANATVGGHGKLVGNYISAINDKVTWSGKDKALLFTVEGVAAPTANEGVSATEVKVIATDGAINVKNAAGKNVVVSTILGQIVANEVLTSDNATISVPAGIVIVSVDGEEAVKVNVK